MRIQTIFHFLPNSLAGGDFSLLKEDAIITGSGSFCGSLSPLSEVKSKFSFSQSEYELDISRRLAILHIAQGSI